MKRVVILGRDGIEHVVVAAGAGDGEAEEAFGHGVDPVIDDVVHVTEALAHGEEAERGEVLVGLFGTYRRRAAG